MADAISRRGRPATLRRVVSSGADQDVAILAILAGGAPLALAGSIQINAFTAIVAAETILAAGWPAPPRDNDRLIFAERAYTVQGNPDPRYVGDRIGAWVMQVRG